MASGSQNMTTYNARIVTGSNNAASPAGALLLSGAGRADDATGDTWIFLDSKGGTTNPWGIKHDQANNKLQIFGSGTNSVSVRMNTGDTYILGKVGIGYDPETSGNTYKLYVDGSSYFTNHMYIGRNDSAHIYLINKNWTKGTNPSSQTYSAIEYNDTNNSRVALLESTLDTSGNSRFNIYLVPNVADSTSWSGIVLQKTNADVLTVNIAGTTTVNGTVHANGGYLESTVNGNTVQIGSQNTGFCHITNTANIPFWFNKDIYIERGKTIGAAGTVYCPFQIYLGRNTTAESNALNATSPLIEFSNSDRSQYCQLIYTDYDTVQAPDSLTLVGNQNGITFICKNGPIWVQGGSNAGGNVNRLTTSSGMPGNMQYNTSRRGTQIYSNGIAFADPYNGNSNSDAGWIRHQETTSNAGELEIAVGDDGDETIVVRQYNTSNGIKRTLTLLNSSGYTLFPSYINVPTNNNENPTVSQFIVTNGSDHYYRKASVAHAANAIDGQHKWVRIGSDTMTGTLAIVNNTQNNAKYNALFYLEHKSGNDWGMILNKNNASDYGIDVQCKSDGSYGIRCSGRITGTKVYGAVWNDYAECRNVNTEIAPGYVVYETESGTMEITNKRLQAGCKVVSDTYGMCIGETEEAKTPIAVCGRVLVYPYRNRDEYKLGAALCSAPNGTVDIMTREEIIQYPERIIGTVSEIPNYETWLAGERDGNHIINVNGRIWIYVR